MKQILHIFAKDTRRFWIEIALSLGLLVAFVWMCPSGWSSPGIRDGAIPLIDLYLLLIVSWWLLTARVVHDEPLIGDRQFWLTRPYEWKKLLAAKALFLACWVGLSYLVAQTVVLIQAGFSPREHFAALLGKVLFDLAIFFLPMFVLAAVTSNFVRMMVVLLGVLVVAAWYASFIGTRFGLRPSVSSALGLVPASASFHHDPLLIPVLLCGGAAVLVLAYSTRKAWWARGLAIAIVIAAMTLPSFEHRQSLVDAAYAETATQVPLTVTYAPTQTSPAYAREYKGKDYIGLRMEYSPAQEGYAFSVDDFRFTVTAANGDQWYSPWQGTIGRDTLQPQDGYVSLPLSPGTFNRFNGGPVTLRIEFAVSRYQPGTTARMTFPSDDAAVPGIGFCAPPRDPDGRRRNSVILWCRSAVDDLPPIYVTATASNLACGESPNPGQSEVTAAYGAWINERNVGFGVSTVRMFPLVFGPASAWNGRAVPRYLCPGAPMTVTPYHLADRGRTSITIPNFQFPPRSKT